MRAKADLQSTAEARMYLVRKCILLVLYQLFLEIPALDPYIPCFLLLSLEWDVADVKAWVMERFASETIANNFEKEEVDGCILLSATVRSNEAMETLGLTTIGKKGKFLDETLKLTGTVHVQKLFRNNIL